MIAGYHAHIYFTADSRSSAAELRQRLMLEWNGRVRVYGLIDQAIGPHPLPMFEVDIPSSAIALVREWLQKNHGGHSVLIHPLTGDDLADHRDSSEWVGAPLTLDLEFLKKIRRPHS